jgi:hypothetical protein
MRIRINKPISSVWPVTMALFLRRKEEEPTFYQSRRSRKWHCFPRWAKGLEHRNLPETSIKAIRVLKDSNAKLLNNDTLNLLETTKSSIRDGRDDEKGHDSISLAESAQWKSLPNQLMIFGPDEDFWLELSC